MRAVLSSLAIACELLADTFEAAAALLADLSESEDDRDERLQRGRLDQLWQSSKTPPPAAH